MFTNKNRINVDIVEQDFVKFKNRVGEVDEIILERIIVDNIYTPTLLDRSLEVIELKQLRELSPWGYSFRICKEMTIYDVEGQNSAPHALSEMDLRLSMFDYIFKEYVKNNSLSWLDIATNCGIIPLFIKRNIKTPINVTGIDLSPQNIEKADLLLNMVNDNSIKFTVADAYDYLSICEDESIDVISALGLFYHLSDPLRLMNLIYQKSKNIVIIDTIVHNFDFSGWIQTISRHVKYPNLRHANDTRKIIELHPTYRGMVDTLFQVGFNNVIEIIPSENLLAQFPAYIYGSKNRAVFVAFK